MAGMIAYIGDYGIVAATGADDPKLASALQYMNAEITALQGAGFSDDQVKFNTIKDYMESGAYTNTNSKYFNPGNIHYSNHSKTAMKGGATSEGGNWARYKNLDDYAIDLQRVLQLGPGHPYDATGYPDLTDYVHRLKLNKYFGSESEVSYLKKLQGAQQRLKIIAQLHTDAHQDIVTPGSGNKFTNWLNGLTMTEKVLGGAAAVVLGLVIIKH